MESINLKPLKHYEKENILLTAIEKVIDNVSYEYDISYAEILGVVDILKFSLLKELEEK